MYFFYPSNLDSNKCLNSLSSLLSSDDVVLYLSDKTHTDRMSMDGLYTFTGKVNDSTVGIIYTDFRVNGGSFGSENSQRAIHFIREMQQRNIPLVFLMNSLGARFIDGRTVFDGAFGIIPELLAFKKQNLLITASIGKTLGVSALYFSQGHYRIALREDSLLNLTGPEVHKKFFGNTNEIFEQFSSANHLQQKTTLIHELCDSTTEILIACKNILSLQQNTQTSSMNSTADMSFELEQGGLALCNRYDEKLTDLLTKLADSTYEIFTQGSRVVRTFVGTLNNGQKVGILLNNPGHPNNMLTVTSIDRCLAAMDLFKALKLPVISVLDCPGGDPRKKESDADAIMKMIQLAHVMIEYPFKKMGIIYGRCYGGSSMFAFPKIFGGEKNIAIKGSDLGVMHRSIILELLADSKRLLQNFLKRAEQETADLADLIACGTIDQVVDKEDVREEVLKFLELSPAMESSQLSLHRQEPYQ